MSNTLKMLYQRGQNIILDFVATTIDRGAVVTLSALSVLA